MTSDSVTRTGGGAGLGLYICNRLISAMDGDILVDSSVGEGTTFRVSLPVIAASMPSERMQASSPPYDLRNAEAWDESAN